MQVIDHSSSSALLDLSLDLSTLVVVEDESGPILNQFLDSTEVCDIVVGHSLGISWWAFIGIEECKVGFDRGS